jgi:hypothetical protein
MPLLTVSVPCPLSLLQVEDSSICVSRYSMLNFRFKPVLRLKALKQELQKLKRQELQALKRQ